MGRESEDVKECRRLELEPFNTVPVNGPGRLCAGLAGKGEFVRRNRAVIEFLIDRIIEDTISREEALIRMDTEAVARLDDRIETLNELVETELRTKEDFLLELINILPEEERPEKLQALATRLTNVRVFTNQLQRDIQREFRRGGDFRAAARRGRTTVLDLLDRLLQLPER